MHICNTVRDASIEKIVSIFEYDMKSSSSSDNDFLEEFAAAASFTQQKEKRFWGHKINRNREKCSAFHVLIIKLEAHHIQCHMLKETANDSTIYQILGKIKLKSEIPCNVTPMILYHV